VKENKDERFCSLCFDILKIRSRDFKENVIPLKPKQKPLLSIRKNVKSDICPICKLSLPVPRHACTVYHKECAITAQRQSSKKYYHSTKVLK
jgi:uncharacterized protein YbbK (DUF523 family)